MYFQKAIEDRNKRYELNEKKKKNKQKSFVCFKKNFFCISIYLLFEDKQFNLFHF